MPKNGIIFDIVEFTINDGPGIRITVFMKGCPLRCLWCHNPEGINFEPQMNYKTGKIIGKEWTVNDLVNKLNKFQDVFNLSQGGVTFSGGEPTCQAEFLFEVAQKIPHLHKNLDTSGYCEEETFKKLIAVFDLIYFDLKLINNEQHKKYTGVSNETILKNLEILSKSNVPFHIRIPIIPTITDTSENLDNIKNLLLSLNNKPDCIDIIPYNKLAGGKYPIYKMEYRLKELNQNVNNNNIIAFKTEMEQYGFNLKGDSIE